MPGAQRLARELIYWGRESDGRGVAFQTKILRVAQWVTMMHDGRVVAEGTPAEIRANETVHELYLGSRYYDE